MIGEVAVTGIEALPPHLRQTWAAARVWAANQAPYPATALLALDPVVASPGERTDQDLCPLPADPRWHVYLDAEVLATTEVPVLGFWLLHQVTHLLRSHAERYPGAGRADQVRWNAAADAEINDDLVAGDVRRPVEAITPSSPGLVDGRTAEEYWDALRGCIGSWSGCSIRAGGAALGHRGAHHHQGAGAMTAPFDPAAWVATGFIEQEARVWHRWRIAPETAVAWRRAGGDRRALRRPMDHGPGHSGDGWRLAGLRTGCHRRSSLPRDGVRPGRGASSSAAD